MLMREAADVFWQTLKDTWEELVPLAVVNLVWLLLWAGPFGLASLVTQIPALAILLLVIGLLLFSIATAGAYEVTSRVAHARTFHFSDFIEAARRYWWRSILWLLGNLLVVFVIAFYILVFLPAFTGIWVGIVAGILIGLLVIWLVMQIYFWPLMIAQEEPRVLTAWRNAFFLIMANPFFAFFIAAFALVLLGISVAITLPFVLVGIVLQGLLGNNAVLTLLSHYEKIESPRPEDM